MEIKPFRALRFNEAVVGDTGKCISPPYDVISLVQQEHLNAKSQHNIARIIKGVAAEGDNQRSNQYTRAAELLETWISTNALTQDATEAIYAYVQDFQIGGADFQRFTFIALGKLEEFGDIVRPHEKILDKPVIDRLNLTKATKSQFGLIFMVYDDYEGVADKAIQKTTANKPLIDFLDDDNVHHRLFAITDKDIIDGISRMMRDKNCIIADGHHRYTTGLLYAKENGNPASKYQMLALCNTHHEGLIVLATHRLVGELVDFDATRFLSGLKENFDVTEYTFDSEQTKQTAKEKMLEMMETEHQKNNNAFGIYAATNAFYVAVLADKSAMD